MAPMSTPCEGCSATITRASRVSSRAICTFCWLPPDSERAGLSKLGAAHVEHGDQLGARRARLADGKERPALELAEMPDRQVLPDGALRRQARRAPRSAGNIGEPRCRGWRAACRRSACPRSSIVPAARHPQPGDAFDEFVLAVALHAGEPDDLAAADLNRRPVDRDFAAVAHGVRFSTSAAAPRRPRLLLGHSQQHRPPDHQSGDLLRRHALVLDGRHGPALPHHRDAVGRLEHLAQLVRDEDDGMALARRALRMLTKSSRVSCGVSTAVGSSRMSTRALR